jgi:hypothetical protein
LLLFGRHRDGHRERHEAHLQSSRCLGGGARGVGPLLAGGVTDCRHARSPTSNATSKGMGSSVRLTIPGRAGGDRQA